MNLKLVSVLSVVGLLVACGDSGSSSTTGGSDTGGGGSDNGGGGEGGDGGIAPVGPVGGGPGNGGSGGGEEPGCYDDGAALVFPESTGFVQDQGLCTTEQLDSFFDSCLTMGGDCMTWADDMANDACQACLAGGATPGPAPVLTQSEMFTYLSFYACQANAMDLPECAVPVQALLFCANTSCESCGDDDESNACINFAINPGGICGDNVELPAGCEAVLSAADLAPECIGTATTFEEAFPILADHVCGAP